MSMKGQIQKTEFPSDYKPFLQTVFPSVRVFAGIKTK